jgi:hypothetical protein
MRLEVDAMTEPDHGRQVKLIRADGSEVDCVVERPDERPWSVVLANADAGEAVPQPWQVIIFLESMSASDGTPVPLLFETEAAARKWVDKHGFADRFTWDDVDPDNLEATATDVPTEFVEQFSAIADKHGVEPNSSEAIELARNDEQFKDFKSLVFYPERGYGITATESAFPVPQGKHVKLPWRPASLRHTGSSDLFDAKDKRFLRIRVATLDLDDLPFDVVYAFNI